MTKEKKYLVTEEICDLFDELTSIEHCRDKAIGNVWGTKRAIQFGKKLIQGKRKTYDLIFRLYPELSDKQLTFYPESKEVKIKE